MTDDSTIHTDGGTEHSDEQSIWSNGSPTRSDDRSISSSIDRLDNPRGSPHPLVTTAGRIRRDPWLLVPFFLVGLGLTALDWARRQDPIPALEQTAFDGNTRDVQIEFVGYPTGVSQTAVSLESLVDLHAHLLVWGALSYVLPLLAVAAAGAYTMARAMGRESWLGAAGWLFGFALVIDLANRLFGSIDVLQGMDLWWGLPILALYLFVMVRLFAVPGLLVAGRGLPAAVSESSRRIAGRGWGVFGLVLLFGLGAWLLAGVSTVGALVSTAVVAPLHAVTIVTVLDLEGEG